MVPTREVKHRVGRTVRHVLEYVQTHPMCASGEVRWNLLEQHGVKGNGGYKHVTRALVSRWIRATLPGYPRQGLMITRAGIEALARPVRPRQERKPKPKPKPKRRSRAQ